MRARKKRGGKIRKNKSGSRLAKPKVRWTGHQTGQSIDGLPGLGWLAVQARHGRAVRAAGWLWLGHDREGSFPKKRGS
jgi:hypothetical protein